MKNTKTNGNEKNVQIALARARNLSVSTKHSVEISRNLRYKNTTFAKKYLEAVINYDSPVSFKRHVRNTGHKSGMSAGRYPVKAAKEFLKLIKSVESNAQFKGMDLSNLKITKLMSNQASIPRTGGRQRYATKRTHIDVEVMIGKTKKNPKEEKKVQKEVKQEPKHNHEHTHQHETKTKESKGHSQ